MVEGTGGGTFMNELPKYNVLMLPLLKVTGSRNEMTTKQMRDEVAASSCLKQKASLGDFRLELRG